MNNNDLKQIAEDIKEADSIALFTHISPDCDAVGSVYSMHDALSSLGKKVAIFSKDEMKAEDKLLFDSSLISRECSSDEFDLFIACDVPASHRLGEYEEIFLAKDTRIIDRKSVV